MDASAGSRRGDATGGRRKDTTHDLLLKHSKTTVATYV
jgi:hypothetical protein